MTVIYRSGSVEYTCNNDLTEYLKNNKLLKNEDGNIEYSEFKSLIRAELRNFMNPFDNIVFLLGAGASVVGDRDPKYGHTVDMLGGEIYKTLNSKEIFSLDELSDKCKYYKYDDKDSDGNRLFNLEDFLSRMQSYR
ncbi:hypothetical protein NHG35_08470, partial [Aerococcaceae bacterium NML180378]|nr:hypothetical protein [Aerococcaceae bacterium NML180378]